MLLCAPRKVLIIKTLTFEPLPRQQRIDKCAGKDERLNSVSENRLPFGKKRGRDRNGHLKMCNYDGIVVK